MSKPGKGAPGGPVVKGSSKDAKMARAEANTPAGGKAPSPTRGAKEPVVIKPPSTKKGAPDSAAAIAAKAGRRNTPMADKIEKDAGPKIRKPGMGKKDMPGQGGGGKKKKKKSGKAKKKSCFSSLLASFGLGGGVVTLTDPAAIEAAQALDLQGYHLRRLKARFDLVDIDGSGAIDANEFFESVGEERSPFTDKLFALIDLDGSGTIEFDEYVRVLATYCMFSKDEILRFCFECFDVDGSGTIDEKEFMELCRTVNNANPTFPANFRRALEEFDVNEDGLIDYGEFQEIDRRYPLVLFPAFRLQDTMQRNSLGEAAWVKVIEGYTHQKKIEEYKATHGGRLPPDPPLKAIAKIFCPCMFRERVHAKLGADMEAKHRADNK